jgi:hypothetical protein
MKGGYVVQLIKKPQEPRSCAGLGSLVLQNVERKLMAGGLPNNYL